VVVVSRSRDHWWGLGVMVVLLALTLAGCSFFDRPTPMPAASDLIGVWVHKGPGGVDTTLTLNHNGTFQVDKIPVQVFTPVTDAIVTSKLDWKDLRSLSGTWSLSGGRLGNEPFLDFSIDPSAQFPGYHTEIIVHGRPPDMSLFHSVGPVDNGVEFHFKKRNEM
jgi:hypothetical protein